MVQKKAFITLHPPFSFGKAFPLLEFSNEIVSVRNIALLRRILYEIISYYRLSIKDDPFDEKMKEVVDESVKDVEALQKIILNNDLYDLSFRCCIAKVIWLLPFGNFRLVLNSRNLLKIHKTLALRQILKGFISLLMLFHDDWNDILREVLEQVKENYKFFKKEIRELLKQNDECKS
ncbi:MAG: hypothetical protein ACTSVV_09920 [Promethearchaeota archaeon]